MNIPLLMRLEQICSSLQSEGWVYVGQANFGTCGKNIVKYRHPNGSRISIECLDNSLVLFKNKKCIKKEIVPDNPLLNKDLRPSALPPRYVKNPK